MLKQYDIDFKWLKRGYDEPSDLDSEQIVKKAVKQLADDLKKPVFIEDTSVELEAYPGFPGSLPKFVFEHIGYDGLFRLIRKKSRKARFFSHIGFCMPKKRPKVFTASLEGRITHKVYHKEMNTLPYNRIFIPKGFNRPLAVIPKEELYEVTHRYKAFKAFAEYLQKNKVLLRL